MALSCNEQHPEGCRPELSSWFMERLAASWSGMSHRSLSPAVQQRTADRPSRTNGVKGPWSTGRSAAKKDSAPRYETRSPRLLGYLWLQQPGQQDDCPWQLLPEHFALDLPASVTANAERASSEVATTVRIFVLIEDSFQCEEDRRAPRRRDTRAHCGLNPQIVFETEDRRRKAQPRRQFLQ
jgi:hypothetical protein